MKTITQAAIKKAAGLTAAIQNEQHKSYQGMITMSTEIPKKKIGELLFCLEFPIGKEISQVGWGLFEVLLPQYIELKLQGGRG